MTYQGVLKKMMTENSDEIQYYLDMKSNFFKRKSTHKQRDNTFFCKV
jgi:hypothetical protein